MHELLRKFYTNLVSGDIECFKPLPLIFTFAELEYLYNEGYITVINDAFVSAVEAKDIQEV